MKTYFTICMIVLFVTGIISAQSFTKITDSTNPITNITQGGYPGTSWIDYNNDDLPDLFINPDRLFKNEGNGSFSANSTLTGKTQAIGVQQVIGSGNSWADYNNDGHIDLFFSSGKSFLFKNNGDETFSKVTEGQIADSIANRGWSCAWADYDNDGNVDLLIVHPANFVPGAPTSNHLYHNDGPPNYTFTRVSVFEFTTVHAPYTVATWYDHDLDGDMDLFIASGPASQFPARDYLYKNMLTETGAASFLRINDSPIGTDKQDGQVWNWIDIENDGDLDAFVTNYSGAANRLYLNEGGTFKESPSGMELSGVQCLTNTWGDLDNDGYQDVIITSETKNYIYHNQGDGAFTPLHNSIDAVGAERGATIGDYDNDGDLDVYIVGFPVANGLFRNDNNNGNNWIKFKLTGTQSNKSAIGTTIKVKANINGKQVWLLRQVVAQNSFNSQNSLIQHFGLGNASVIDSVMIDWPSGEKQVLVNIPVNSFQSITEQVSTSVEEKNTSGYKYDLYQNYPNPFNPSTIIEFSLPEKSFIELDIFDILGTKVAELFSGEKEAGRHSVSFNAAGLTSGTYYCRMRSGELIRTSKMQLIK